MDHGRKRNCLLASIAMLVVLAAAFAPGVLAAPTGASVQNISQSNPGQGIGGNRTDARSTITTLILNATQQDTYWKAYVGNVTGKLTLDDANSFTIYDWSLIGVTMSGRVYATRNGSVLFSSVGCANSSIIGTEEAFLNMTGSAIDSINRTFSGTVHKTFLVGEQTIANSTCRSTATYVNDAAQPASENALYQEILLQDSAENLIYATLVDDDETGYNGDSYDFQMIVGESDRKPAPTTYYFFTEISSS